MPLYRCGLKFLAVLAAGATACNPRRPPPQPHPECPTHEISLSYADRGGSVSAGTIGLSPNIATIPEFHDCQRLLTPDNRYAAYGVTGLVFGPLVAVFAAETLAVQGAFAGITPDLGVAVATVYSYDGDYLGLGIRQYFNCLYFFKSLGPQPYTAKMVPNIGEDCKHQIQLSETISGTLLNVDQAKGQHDPGDVPPVARWDWNGHEQYLGVKCGTEWCSVGLMSSVQDPKVSPLNAPMDVVRTFSVKGYHDEEMLAPAKGRDWNHHSTPAPGDFVRPDSIRGTVVPVPAVGTLGSGAFQNQWSKVATVYLEGPAQRVGLYEAKYGFSGTPWSSSDIGNVVELCESGCPDLPDIMGSKSCKEAQATAADENAKTATNNSSVWFARISSATVTPAVKHLCVIRRRHPAFTSMGWVMPNTARWRWLLDDPSIWVPCDGACCQVRGN